MRVSISPAMLQLLLLFTYMSVRGLMAQDQELPECRANLNNTCFSQCFSDSATTNSSSSIQSYTELCNLVSKARKARMTSGLLEEDSGTTVAFDLTENNVDVMEYQKNLGSLLVLTLAATVGGHNDDSSPFFFAEYHNVTVNINSTSSCHDECSAARYAQSLQFLPQDYFTADNLSQVCDTNSSTVMCDGDGNGGAANNSANTAGMLLAIRNSPVTNVGLTACSARYKARMLVSLNPYLVIDGTNTTMNSTEAVTTMSRENLRVSHELLTCVQKSCGCGDSLPPGETTTTTTPGDNASNSGSTGRSEMVSFMFFLLFVTAKLRSLK